MTIRRRIRQPDHPAPATVRTSAGTRFGPGNPGGRLKKTGQTMETIRHAIRECTTPLQAQQLIQTYWELGMRGNVRAGKVWLEYAAGKPLERTEQSGTLTLLDPTLQGSLIDMGEPSPLAPLASPRQPRTLTTERHLEEEPTRGELEPHVSMVDDKEVEPSA